MSAAVQAPAAAEPVDLVALPDAARPVDLAQQLYNARATLRAVSAVLQGFVQVGALSDDRAGQVERLVQVAAGSLLLASAAAAPPADAPAVRAMAEAEARARAAVLGDLADSADGLGAGLELVAECCSSGDDRRVSQACRVAFTLASVAADLAMALGDEVDREADAAPLLNASGLLDSAEGLAAGLELIAEGCASSDDRRVAQAGRLASTLASVAVDLAEALSHEATREADSTAQGRAS